MCNNGMAKNSNPHHLHKYVPLFTYEYYIKPIPDFSGDVYVSFCFTNVVCTTFSCVCRHFSDDIFKRFLLNQYTYMNST